MALQPMAVSTLHALMGRDEYPTVQLGAARDVLDRTEGRPTETVNLNASVSVIRDRLLSARKRVQSAD